MCISSLETILFRIFCVHTTRMTLFINTLQISRCQCQTLISFIVLKIVVPRLLKIRIRNERHSSCNFFRIFFLSTLYIYIYIYKISDMVFKDFPFTKLFCDFSSREFLNHHQLRIIFTLQKTAYLVTLTE